MEKVVMNIKVGDMLEYKSKVVENLTGICIVLAKKCGDEYFDTEWDVEWISYNLLDAKNNSKSILIFNGEFGTWKKLS
jgi:hypothetical protein